MIIFSILAIIMCVFFMIMGILTIKKDRASGIAFFIGCGLNAFYLVTICIK